MIDLSILVCSVHTRYDTFLPKIQKQLFDQYDALSEEDKARVEILVLMDNKKMMLGHKRNVMVDMAQGRYLQFTDDDDRVSDDFIASLLDATKSNADCISFQAEVRLNGGPPKICFYSRSNLKDYNTADAYYRIPNHICCVKKEISLKSSFPSIEYGEDSAYSKLLLKNIKSETKLDKVLYYYDYDDETTETQTHINHKSRVRTQKPIVDVVILSNAKTPNLRRMTNRAVRSCVSGANALPINVIVLEQQPGIEYADATTIRMTEKFNYNAFCNIGARQGESDWIVFANNDLRFTDGWLHQLLAVGHPVMSPRSPKDLRQQNITEDETGFVNGRNFSGWCFMLQRSLYNKIGGLDECVDFWCSDDVTIEQVKAQGVEPMLVAGSVVHHLTSQTLRFAQADTDDLTWRNVKIFNEKYNQTKFEDNPTYLEWLRKN